MAASAPMERLLDRLEAALSGRAMGPLTVRKGRHLNWSSGPSHGRILLQSHITRFLSVSWCSSCCSV